MLGLAYYEADRCNGCGKPLSVTTQAEAEEWLVTRHVCSACEMLAIQQKALDPKEHKHPSAYLWTAEKQT